MRVRYTRRAFADRKAIYAYLHERNPVAALRIDRLIAERVERLGEAPLLGRPTDRAGIHTLWVAPYPYRRSIGSRARPSKSFISGIRRERLGQAGSGVGGC